MAKYIDIVCKYFQVRERDGDEVTERFYDLRPWMHDLGSMDYLDRYKNANGIKGRLEDMVHVTKEVYAFNFMRMEDISTSYILNMTDPATHVDIDIEADEYIAKNTVCLYDAEHGILMIQSNRGSYSDKSIESYINEFHDEPVCSILPIFENINFLGDNTKYMKLDVRLANLREIAPTQGTSFEKILDGLNEVEGLNAHIEVSLGSDRNAQLNNGEVKNVLVDLYNNRGCVTSAKIKLTDDQISGVYDLFDNLSKDIIKCQVDKKGGISFDLMASRMNDRYTLEHAQERVLNALLNN